MEEKRDFNTQEPTEKTIKGKKSFYLKIIALALCCSLLGGIIGGGAVIFTGNIIAENELSEILKDNKGFTIESHFRFRNPFAFHLGIAKDFLEEEILKEPYIGISITDSSDPTGALVDSVEKGSPAAKGTLQSGDVITMVNNAKIYSGDDLAKIIEKTKSGDELLLTVYRQGDTVDCTVTVGEHSRFGK